MKTFTLVFGAVEAGEQDGLALRRVLPRQRHRQHRLARTGAALDQQA